MKTNIPERQQPVRAAANPSAPTEAQKESGSSFAPPAFSLTASPPPDPPDDRQDIPAQLDPEPFVVQRSNGVVIQMSPLSDELRNIYDLEGRDAFFESLRSVRESDADVLEFIRTTLTGEDRTLAENIFQYGPENQWPPEVRARASAISTTDLGVIGEARTGVGITGHRFVRLYVNPDIYGFLPRDRFRVRLNVLNSALYDWGLEHAERADTDPAIRQQIETLKSDILTWLREERERRVTPIREAEGAQREAGTTVETLRTGDLRPLVIHRLQIDRAMARLLQLIQNHEPSTPELDGEIRSLTSGAPDGMVVPELPSGALDENMSGLSNADRRTLRQQLARMRSRLDTRELRDLVAAERARETAGSTLERLRGRASSNPEEIDRMTTLINDGNFLSTVPQSYYFIPGTGRGARPVMPLTPVESLYRESVALPSGYQHGGSVRPSEEIMGEVGSAHFSGDDIARAIDVMEGLGHNEGRMDSINTWDRLSLTVGPGLGGSTRQRDGSYVANGRFQTKLWEFRRQHRDVFYDILGRFGIDMEQAGRGRWPMMTVVVPRPREGEPRPAGDTHAPGTVLHNMDALNYIIEDPILLTQIRRLGENPEWQRYLLNDVAESSISGAFQLQIPVEGGGPLALRDIVAGLPEPLVRVVFATAADQIHGVGNDAGLIAETAAIYTALAEEFHFQPGDPAQMSPAAREQFVVRMLRRPHMEGRENRFNGYMEGIDGLRAHLERLGVVERE